MDSKRDNSKLALVIGSLLLTLAIAISFSNGDERRNGIQTTAEQSSTSSENAESPSTDTEQAPENETTTSASSAPVKTPKGNALVEVTEPVDKANSTVQNYVGALAAQGFSSAGQGVWMQSDKALLANHQGTAPLSAASLTKVATTLAALESLGVIYRFSTVIGTNGSLSNGVLSGDLIVQGSGDPFFVWEEAIALGNVLNQLGISTVTGDLIIVDNFYMNYERSPLTAGDLLQEGMNSALWGGEAQNQFNTLPAGTARPRVSIQGSVRTGGVSDFQLLVNHESLPLPELLKNMNQNSYYVLAEMLADAVGG